MRLFSFLVLILVLWLATCSAPRVVNPTATALPTQTSIPPTLTPFPPTPTASLTPEPKLPAAPFDAEVYVNEAAGFALDYPAGWTVNEVVAGPRGMQVQFLSRPGLAESPSVPEGEMRFTATIYQWDPKNDLAAYVANRKTAWSASGFTVLDEQQLTLEQGLPAVQFIIQTPEAQVLFLLTALQDQYLEVAGEGDPDLMKQIVQRVRPIS